MTDNLPGRVPEFLPEGLGSRVVWAEDRSDAPMERLRVYFDNGYGISIVRGPWSYGGPNGLFEIAVLDHITDSITYDTPVTDDVVGWLTVGNVREYALLIANLPARIDNPTKSLES